MNCASWQYFIRIEVHRDGDIHRQAIEIWNLTILIGLSYQLGWLFRLTKVFGQTNGNLVPTKKNWLSPCCRQRYYLGNML